MERLIIRLIMKWQYRITVGLVKMIKAQLFDEIISNTKFYQKTLKVYCSQLKKLENLLNYDSLDIVAITKSFRHFQVRPITVEHSFKQSEDQELFNILESAEKSFAGKQKSSSFVLGKKALFGVMPDWNPAEIIGTKPNSLATSLYSDLYFKRNMGAAKSGIWL